MTHTNDASVGRWSWTRAIFSGSWSMTSQHLQVTRRC